MEEIIIMGIYVDYMIIIGSNSHKIVKLKEDMKKVFEVIVTMNMGLDQRRV